MNIEQYDKIRMRLDDVKNSAKVHEDFLVEFHSHALEDIEMLINALEKSIWTLRDIREGEGKP